MSHAFSGWSSSVDKLSHKRIAMKNCQNFDISEQIVQGGWPGHRKKYHLKQENIEIKP